MKNRNMIIILIFIAIITIVIFVARSKYVLDKETFHTQNSEKFYLVSNSLGLEAKENNYINWDGKSNYTVHFTVKNYDDEIRVNNLVTKYTVTPIITSETENTGITISTSINGTSTNVGQMQANVKQDDDISITINPNGKSFSNVSLRVELQSIEPYNKTLIGDFIVSKSDNSTYQVNLEDSENHEYAKMLIRTDEYSGILRIYYNNLLSAPDMTDTLLDGVAKQKYSENIYYIDVNLKSNSNYQIEFIKNDITSTLTLGDEIRSSDISVEIP